MIKAMCAHWQRGARPLLKIVKKVRNKLCFERRTELEDVEVRHTGDGITFHTVS